VLDESSEAGFLTAMELVRDGMESFWFSVILKSTVLFLNKKERKNAIKFWRNVLEREGIL
jgi:hypothetical protein